MNAHKRLITYCADQIVGPSEIKTIGNTRRLLRALILFDHVILHSIRLREIPAFVADLGLEATTELLRSGTITILPDFVQFGTLGEKDNPYPVDVHSIAMLAGGRRYSLPNYFADLHKTLSVPLQPSDRLQQAIRSALTDEPHKYGTIAKSYTDAEILENSFSLRTAVAARLKRVYGFAIGAHDFNLKLHPIKEGIYRAESNLAALCRLSETEVHGVIGLSLAALAHLNLRIEEMRTYSSISGFNDEDLAIFDSRTRVLLERQNAHINLNQFQRLVSLLALPQIPAAPGQFDIDRFMKMRASTDCSDFRKWLSECADWSDAEIVDHVGSFREAVSRYYQSPAGKITRFIVSSGIGAVPGVGTLLGPAVSALDSFLLDRVLKPSGAIAFIGSAYPSLFRSD